MPFGSLVEESVALSEAKDSEVIITVGDVVSLSMLESGIQPQLMIFDFISERSDMPKLRSKLGAVKGTIVKVNNPPGHITPQLLKAIRKALKTGGRTKMQVQGEEDLAALVCAALASDGAILMYGLPKQGIVLVKIDQSVRNKAIELLNSMEECN